MACQTLPKPNCTANPLSLRDLPGCITCAVRAITGFDYPVIISDGRLLLTLPDAKDDDLLPETVWSSLRDGCQRTCTAFDSSALRVTEASHTFLVETPAPLEEISYFVVELEAWFSRFYRDVLSIRALRMDMREVTFSLRDEEGRGLTVARIERLLQASGTDEISGISPENFVWNQQGDHEVLLRIPCASLQSHT